MAVIDADAHVHECDRTWDFFEEADRQYKPLVVAPVDGPEPSRKYWVIDGKMRPRGGGNVGKATPREYRELEDVEGRLRHMDELGIDIQVLYPSILTKITERTETEDAMWRAYNRWMADAWQRGQGRLRWVCRVPLGSIESGCAELRFAKEHGACGVFLRSFEGERLLCDPFFFPLYEEASALNMPICVHASLGNQSLVDLLSQPPDGGSFMKFKMSVISACHTLIMNNIPEQFPRLRFGFIEVSADWVPYVVRELQKRTSWKGLPLAENVIRDNRIFVACQVDDDLPHVLKYSGDDNLVIGTDYGHADTSSDLYAIKELQAREDVDPAVIRKIVDDNARALYGL
jgi:predicted TIM-barrel fold metal-dependent hydrolase